jgi:pimeloyl-ACP methyl ester carboxylesterase
MTATANLLSSACVVTEPIQCIELRVDAGVAVPGEPIPEIAVHVYWPGGKDHPRPSIALFCLPGGSINAGYYDLGGAEQPSFSFARQLAKHGLITIAIDHLGVGASTRTSDILALTPDKVAAANSNATRQITDRIRTGCLAPGLAAVPDLATIGVGHSMGALLTALQQATYSQHSAVALLGYSDNGLIQHLPSQAHHMAGESELIPDAIEALAREIYASGWPEMARSEDTNSIFYGSKADPVGVQALKAVGDKLLVVPGLQSMIPGNMAHLLARITVPVFLGLGDLDIAGSPHTVPASFAGSGDVTLFVLPDTGHCHFIFPSRGALFERVAQWVATVRATKVPADFSSLPTV